MFCSKSRSKIPKRFKFFRKTQILLQALPKMVLPILCEYVLLKSRQEKLLPGLRKISTSKSGNVKMTKIDRFDHVSWPNSVGTHSCGLKLGRGVTRDARALVNGSESTYLHLTQTWVALSAEMAVFQCFGQKRVFAAGVNTSRILTKQTLAFRVW